MLGILILVICFNLLHGAPFDGHCKYANNCNAEDAHILSVECDALQRGCHCNDGTSGCHKEGETITYDKLTPDWCKELCLNNTDCKFFKWEQGYISKTCNLMSASQCYQMSSSTCRIDHCKSAGVDCMRNIFPNHPEGKSCKVDLTHNPERLHWFCYNKGTRPVSLEVYAKGGTIVPPETVCETSHECIDHHVEVSRTLKYICGDPEQNIWNGTWTHAKGTFNADAEVLTNNGAVLNYEPLCKGSPLKGITKNSYEQNGLEIICSEKPVEIDVNTPDSYQIPSPNICLLMCDLDHVMTFYTDWDTVAKEGRMKWFKYNKNELDNPIEASGADIYCWPDHREK